MRRTLQAIVSTLAIVLLSSCSCLFNAADDWSTHEIAAEYPKLSLLEIHAGLEQWIPELFVQEAHIAVTHSNAETGRILARGHWSEATIYAPKQKADIRFVLTIDIEEKQAHYRLDSLQAYSGKDERILPQIADTRQFHLDAQIRFQSMVDLLSRALQAESADW